MSMFLAIFNDWNVACAPPRTEQRALRSNVRAAEEPLAMTGLVSSDESGILRT